MPKLHGSKARQVSHRRRDPADINPDASTIQESMISEHEASVSLQHMHISDRTGYQPIISDPTGEQSHSDNCMSIGSFIQY